MTQLAQLGSIPAPTTAEEATPLAVSPVELISTLIPAGFTMPVAGATVTVAISPLGVVTASAFVPGDKVAVAQNDPSGALVRIAYFEVAAVPVGDDVVLTALSKSDPESPVATAGDVFAANCEIVGQTRLPARPADATRCEVVVSESQTLTNAAANESDAAHAAANYIVGGLFPVMRAGLKLAGNVDVDLVERFGVPINIYGSIEFKSESQMAAARLVCATLNRFRPVVEVIFYGV